jgi:hypothetical protein
LKRVVYALLGAMAATQSVYAQVTTQGRTQVARSVEHRFEVALVAAQDSRRDETASPLLYSGLAGGAAVGYERVSERTTFSASADARVARLLPSVRSPGGVQPNELFTGAAFRVAFARALNSRRETKNEFALGVELATDISGVRHTYADPSRREHDYGMGLATLGPQASWARRIVGGAAAVRVSVPVVAFVVRPYADLRSAQDRWPIHFAFPSTFQQVRTELSYARPLSSLLDLSARYRFDVTHVNGEQPIRSATQSLRFGFVLRAGGER